MQRFTHRDQSRECRPRERMRRQKSLTQHTAQYLQLRELALALNVVGDGRDSILTPGSATVTPRLAPMHASRPSSTNGRVSSSSNCSAVAEHLAMSTSFSCTANSSPPSRDTVSAARTTSSMRRATCFSNSSPAALPSVSSTHVRRDRRTACGSRAPSSDHETPATTASPRVCGAP